MKFEPLEDRVLIKPDNPEESRGLIYIPEGHRQKEQIGTVIAVSGGIRNSLGQLVEPIVRVGDRVLFGKYTGTEIKMEETNYIIMRDRDILGLVRDEPKATEH